MIKIWGRVNSVNVKKALWCLDELSLPYERTDAGLQHGVVNTPEYRKMNPNGLVPTLQEDGFTIWESHTIVRYLCDKYGKGVLRPMDLEPRIVANQWMDWAFSFQSSVRDGFWNLIRTPEDKRDLKAIEASRVKSGQMAAILDAALADRMYVAGAFSMGDIPIGAEVQRWMRLPIERPKLPHLEAWFERLCARPAFKKHVDIPLS
jgi:glutathione S-transferase